MAFPGTYNFNYYKGDTYQFKIYPKDSAGNKFDLTNFASATGSVAFTIADKRGNSPVTIIKASAYITTLSGQQAIVCTIRPEDGELMAGNSTYVYDVQIKDASGIFPYIYTLLTGNISVTDQVSTPAVTTSKPNVPTSFVVDSHSTSAVSISWTAPTHGVDNAATGYMIFRAPAMLVDYQPVPTANPSYLGSSTSTSYTDSTVTSGELYVYGIVATNSAGPSINDVVAAYLANPATAPILIGAAQAVA